MKKSTKIILIVAIALVTLFVIFAIVQFGRYARFRKPPTIASDTTVVAEHIDTVDYSLNGDTSQAEDTKAIYELQQFPKSGNDVKDFVVGHYEIAMEDEGFLDEDNLKDVVLVLQNKYDSTDVRPTLVYSNNKPVVINYMVFPNRLWDQLTKTIIKCTFRKALKLIVIS